jgi:cardiolipin synthase
MPDRTDQENNNQGAISQKIGVHKEKLARKWEQHRKMAFFMFAMHLLGVATSYHALMSTRTSQGAIAWIVSLNTVPVVSVPAYWVFGRDKFKGYVTLRQNLESSHDDDIDKVMANVAPYIQTFDHDGMRVSEKLAKLPYFNRNDVQLLINGKATFQSIFEGIDQAKDYILVQFYIVRDDALGRQLKEHLIAKANAGVRVYFLYDEIGTRGIDNYLQDLKDNGVHVSSFHSTQGGGNRFQLNFRNHRKIVVVDGMVGWVGGLNIGNEYLGNDPDFPHWRDTHMKIEGPSALQLQLSFIEDWHWARNEELSLNWEPTPAPSGNASVLILATGPADRLETCSLMYQQAIHSAKKRIWIASPYFVPDSSVMSALNLAILRGVEVKILIPDHPDSKLVYFSAYAFIGELIQSGIEIYRYQPGFLHEKVFLVDDSLAGVGTANFDNRSFRLNFEVTALVLDPSFVKDVETMFLKDFSQSRLMTLENLETKPYWFKVLSRASYLTAPIQ